MSERTLSAREALAQAFDLVRSDTPAAYFRMTDELAGLAIALEVDGECFGAGSDGAQAWTADVPARADVQVAAARATILALLDGRVTQLEACLAGDLAIRADVRLLDRVARAGRAFVDGAVRSRRARALLDDMRQAWASPDC